MKTPTAFVRRVLAIVRSIPRGRVATYGDVAALAGKPRAHRAVGNVMRDCAEPDVPCHRVIAAAGRLGGFGGHAWLKRDRLAAEGLTVVGDRVRRFADVRWQGEPSRRRPADAVATSPSRRTARGGASGRT